jgi:hypothetical protein
MEQQIVGIDVSKAWLVVQIRVGRRFRVGNDVDGIERLAHELNGEKTSCLVVMEASGGYERLSIKLGSQIDEPTLLLNETEPGSKNTNEPTSWNSAMRQAHALRKTMKEPKRRAKRTPPRKMRERTQRPASRIRVLAAVRAPGGPRAAAWLLRAEAAYSTSSDGSSGSSSQKVAPPSGPGLWPMRPPWASMMPLAM